MGTGLGPESYAIIGQERIGQLLSSKPHDRRAIIEEAAGITRFKTKKRLSELRLESAKQNLARVDDIFEEVTRQMNSLKRQASKAERFAAAREELRAKMKVVLASRITLMDLEQARLAEEITLLTTQTDEGATAIGQQEATQHSLTERGYELDAEHQRAQSSASEAAVELERASARERSNTERIAELESRLAAGAAELEQTRTQLTGIAEERTQQHHFLNTAAEEVRVFRLQVEVSQQKAREAADAVFTAERQLEAIAVTPCTCSHSPAMRVTALLKRRKASPHWSAKLSGLTLKCATRSTRLKRSVLNEVTQISVSKHRRRH